MNDPLKTIIKTNPDWINNIFKDSAFERLYKGVHDSSIYTYYRYQRTPIELVTFETPAGEIRLEVPAGSYFAEQDDKRHEPILTDALLNLDNGDIFYDVGGHYGYTASVAQKTPIADDDIHAFEVDSYRAFFLQRNCGEDIHVRNVWVGSEDQDNYVTLDGYARRHDIPDVLKIDVEGAELEVLEGMEWLMEYHSPTLYVEIHPRRIKRFDAELADVFELIRSRDYNLEVADHRQDTEWEPLTAANESEWEQVNGILRATPT